MIKSKQEKQKSRWKLTISTQVQQATEERRDTGSSLSGFLVFNVSQHWPP